MKYIDRNGKESSVPSIKNWMHTIDNMCLVKKILFTNYNIKSMWCRHFNQDPLENYFGSVRRHGSRNTNPSVAAFESAFVSLLVKSIANSGDNTNCERDSCNPLPCMRKIFFSKSGTKRSIDEINDVDIDDINGDIIDDFNEKKKKCYSI